MVWLYRGFFLILALLLAACDNYPAGWPGVDRPFFASCADISGTYSIGTNDEDGTGRNANMDSTFFRNILPPRTAQRWHWETMTIAGDAAQQLDITLMRSPQTMENYRQYLFAQGGKDYYKNKFNNMHSPVTRWSGSFARMTDDEFEANLDKLYLSPVQHYSLKKGKDYECAGGWITGERLVNDPGPDRNFPRPDFIEGIVRFGKDKAGNLLAESVYPEEMYFYVWCGDGCRGPSLGTWTRHKWQRWEAATPAWRGEIPRPWAEPFQREHYGQTPDDSRISLRLTEVRQTLVPMIAAPARVVELKPAGNEVLVFIDSPVLDPYHRMFETVERSYAFSRVQADALERTADGGWRMHLLLGLKPKASDTPIATVENQIRALLPLGATFYKIETAGSGFVLSARCLNQAMVSQLLRNIESSASFHKTNLESFLIGAEGVHDVRVRFAER